MAFRFAPILVPLVFLAAASAADRVLIFTKTAGVRENNIADTRKALKAFYESKGLAADTSESGALMSDTGLARYQAVVFLKNTGDFLNDAQQAAVEKWFKAGGGLQIIHAALDAEMSWSFYGKLIGGAWFQSLPGDSTTRHTIVVEDTSDASSSRILAEHPDRRWSRTDEIYGFRANPRAAKDPAMHILAAVDESSYLKNGAAPKDHPMSWYCTYQGGRAWTTAMGHVTDAFAPRPNAANKDSLFLYHLWGGMQFLLGQPAVRIAPAEAPKARAASLRGFGSLGARFGKDLDKDVKGREAPVHQETEIR